MKAGSELDALIAEKVMGWKKGELNWTIDELWIDSKGSYKWVGKFSPSTNISDAYQVVEKLSPTHCYTICDFGKNKHKKKPHYARFIELKSFNTADDYLPRAETAPLAICFASLRLKGIDINE